MLNLEAIRNAEVHNDPFPFFYIPAVVEHERAVKLAHEFPQIDKGGSFNLNDVHISPAFQAFLDDFDRPEFRRVVCEKFDIDVMDRPMLITLRGYSRARDGRIHTDSKTKLVTLLVYLNEAWQPQTGRLRILRGPTDMEDYVAELLPGPTSMVAFRATENCWHGYPAHEGKRQSIQINFLTSDAAGSKHRFLHGLSARLKSLFK